MAFDAGELESAISSVIFEIVEREKSVSSAASQVRCTSVVSNATVVFLCVILSIVVWLRKEAKIKDESNCALVYAERFLIVQSPMFLLGKHCDWQNKLEVSVGHFGHGDWNVTELCARSAGPKKLNKNMQQIGLPGFRNPSSL